MLFTFWNTKKKSGMRCDVSKDNRGCLSRREVPFRQTAHEAQNCSFLRLRVPVMLSQINGALNTNYKLSSLAGGEQTL